MWRRTSLVVMGVLVAAAVGAQPQPAAPKALKAPLAPSLAPDVQVTLDRLGLTLDAPGLALVADEALFSALQDPVVAARGQVWALSGGSFDYDRGISALDTGRYDRAVEAFDKVIASNDKKADGAMYWKAYALSRLGKREEAIRALEEMQKKFPSSRWTNDARALLIAVRQASGQPVSPESEANEELKLIALNGLMARDPERAIPMVEQLLTASASPKLKERGLFVLAQSAAPRARTLLVEVAKGKGNPDLQLKALDYLGVFAGGPDVPLLVDVYKSTGDIDVKKRVIRSLGMTGRRGFLFGAYLPTDYPAFNLTTAEALGQYDRARTEVERSRVEVEAARERVKETSRDVREATANTLVAQRSAASAEREKAREAKAKEAADALWQLYVAEASAELKREILANLRHSSQADRLLQIARADSNADMRRAALQGLYFDETQKTNEVLLGLYKDEKDPAVKRQILDRLMTTGSAAVLVQLAKQETDPVLKKRIVERLSTMKDKEAVDYMMEILRK